MTKRRKLAFTLDGAPYSLQAGDRITWTEEGRTIWLDVGPSYYGYGYQNVYLRGSFVFEHNGAVLVPNQDLTRKRQTAIFRVRIFAEILVATKLRTDICSISAYTPGNSFRHEWKYVLVPS